MSETRSILLSGATSYLGSHLFHALLGRGDGAFAIDLPYETGGEHGWQQMWQHVAASYDSWQSKYPLPEITRVTYDRQSLQQLKLPAGISEIWHIGEEPQHLEALISLAGTAQIKRCVWVHTKASFPPEDAETQFAHGCQVSGIDHQILRCGIPCGPSLTKKQEGAQSAFMDLVDDLFHGRDVTLAGTPEDRLPLMPVDHLCRDILALHGQNFQGGHCHQIVPDVSVTAGFAFGYLQRTYGTSEMNWSETGTPLTIKTASLIRTLPGKAGVPRLDFMGMAHELRRNHLGERNEQVFRHESKDINGVSINFFRGGTPGKPAVVLVNAIGMPIDFWTRLVATLGNDYAFYTWESRAVPSPFINDADGALAMADHLNDCQALLDTFGLERITLVGWCSGAQVATRFAAEHGEKVEKLVLLNGTYNLQDPAYTTEFMKILTKMMGKVAKNRKYAAMYHRVNYGARQKDLPDDDPMGMDLDYDPALFHLTSFPFKNAESLYQYARLVTQLLAEHSDSWLEKIACPTLVIGGKQDDTAGVQVSERVATLIGCKYEELEDGDHYTLCYHPEVLEQIHSFLGSAS